jgi:hypothetical protein
MNRRSSFTLAVNALVLLLVPISGRAAEGTLQPLPPDGVHYGMTLTDWAVAWWQWNLSIPQTAHPDTRFDTSGRRAGVGQRSPVWFLPGFAPDTQGTRTIVVPEGQAILFQVSGANTDLPGNSTAEELLDPMITAVDETTRDVFEVKVDGQLIPDLRRYTVKTPVFSVSLPPGNIFGLPVSDTQDGRRAAAGYGTFLLFPPPPLGQHEFSVRLAGVFPDSGAVTTTQWTFNVIIHKPNEPLP